MCPACLASLVVLVTGGAFGAMLVARSRPLPTDPSRDEEEADEAAADRLAGRVR